MGSQVSPTGRAETKEAVAPGARKVMVGMGMYCQRTKVVWAGEVKVGPVFGKGKVMVVVSAPGSIVWATYE
jgi:hypothetical protein